MTWKTTAAAQLENLYGLQRTIDDALAQAGFSAAARTRTALAAEEIFANICGYAQAGEVSVSIQADGDTALVTFADDGIPFDPLNSAAPDTDAPAEQRPVGGLGIHMVRHLTAALSYNRIAGRNELTMTIRRKDDKS